MPNTKINFPKDFKPDDLIRMVKYFSEKLSIVAGTKNITNVITEVTNPIPDASQVTIEDSAGNFIGSNVESALAEIISSRTAVNLLIADVAENFIATNVEDALVELYTAIGQSVIANAADIPVEDLADYFTATDVEGVLAELYVAIGAIAAATAATVPIADIADNFTATNVEDALIELLSLIESSVAATSADNVSVIDTAGNFTSDPKNVENVLAELFNLLEASTSSHVKQFGIMDNVSAGEYLPGWWVPETVTIEQVVGYTNSGTVTFQLLNKGSASPNGIDIWSSSNIVAGQTTESPTTVNQQISSGSWIVPYIVSVVGSPTVFSIAMKYALPDTYISGGGLGSDDQTASEVPIIDAGGYYSGLEVESALQEIGLVKHSPGSDNQDATEVSVIDTAENFTSDPKNVENVLAEINGLFDNVVIVNGVGTDNQFIKLETNYAEAFLGLSGGSVYDNDYVMLRGLTSLEQYEIEVKILGKFLSIQKLNGDPIQIKNLAAPTDPTDAVNKQYVDDNTVGLESAGIPEQFAYFYDSNTIRSTPNLLSEGGVITCNGSLQVPSGLVTLHPSSGHSQINIYGNPSISGVLRTSPVDPYAWDGGFSNVQLVTSYQLILRGMSASMRFFDGKIYFGTEFGGSPINVKGVDTPIDDNDAANKAYVENVLAEKLNTVEPVAVGNFTIVDNPNDVPPTYNRVTCYFDIPNKLFIINPQHFGDEQLTVHFASRISWVSRAQQVLDAVEDYDITNKRTVDTLIRQTVMSQRWAIIDSINIGDKLPAWKVPQDITIISFDGYVDDGRINIRFETALTPSAAGPGYNCVMDTNGVTSPPDTPINVDAGTWIKGAYSQLDFGNPNMFSVQINYVRR